MKLVILLSFHKLFDCLGSVIIVKVSNVEVFSMHSYLRTYDLILLNLFMHFILAYYHCYVINFRYFPFILGRLVFVISILPSTQLFYHN